MAGSIKQTGSDAAASAAARRILPGRRSLWQQAVLSMATGLMGTLQRQSRPRALKLGARLGNLGYRLDKRHRRQALRNLYLVFGDAMPPAEREDLARRVFVHYGKTAIDFLRLPGIDDRERDAMVAHVDGFEHVAAARDAGKGIIILTAHMGNWELLGRWLAKNGVKMTVVARDPENPALAEYVRKMREDAGMGVLSRGSSARDLLRILRKGEAAGILPDQNSGDVFVPFFDIPVGTVAGPASLALHTGATIVPSYCVREPDDRYRIFFLPPVPAEATGDSHADVARIMTEANRVLEGVIRQYPDQWLWLHGRWKSSFEEKHRHRWPEGYDYAALSRRWNATI